uniref:Uncharacterized protein n=1 Tax=Knipowitschia caucasica TaxID=637954 RepID=A0AAV2LJP1_KNICA
MLLEEEEKPEKERGEEIDPRQIHPPGPGQLPTRLRGGPRRCNLPALPPRGPSFAAVIALYSSPPRSREKPHPSRRESPRYPRSMLGGRAPPPRQQRHRPRSSSALSSLPPLFSPLRHSRPLPLSLSSPPRCFFLCLRSKRYHRPEAHHHRRPRAIEPLDRTTLCAQPYQQPRPTRAAITHTELTRATARET